jgi:hypothetical protein
MGLPLAPARGAALPLVPQETAFQERKTLWPISFLLAGCVIIRSKTTIMDSIKTTRIWTVT